LGGANYLLPAVTQRRFLVQGLRFQIFYDLEGFQEHIKRMNLSLNFANNPDESGRKSLTDYGVKYFIVNKDLTTTTDWSPYSDTVFENDTFLLLAL
jgi:hypothetical protein